MRRAIACAMRSQTIDRSPIAAPRSIVLLGALVLAVAGCTTLPPTPSPGALVDLPAAWSLDTGTVPRDASRLATWWSRFEDPLLTRLIDDALQANATIESAGAALLQARALRDVSAAALLPTLGLGASGQRNSGGNAINAIGKNVFQAGLDANWELDFFGVNRYGLAASDSNVRASAASLGDVQVSIAAEVALDYIALRGTQARLAIAADNLASQRETLQITQWREQAGLVTAVEAEQARASAESVDAALPALQASIEQSRHALAVLTGRPPAALGDALEAAGAVPRAADDLVLALPAETLRQRPDVRAAEHQYAAAAALVAQAEAARAPNFAIAGSLGLSAATLGQLTSGAAVLRSLLASVSVPLIDGGALRAKVRVQQAVLDQARASYRSTVLTALQDVEDALAAIAGDRVRLTRLQQAADAATRAAALARQRFRSGLIDFQVVLETQRSQLASQDGVVLAGADLGADHVRLYKALGGGWEPASEPIAGAAVPTVPSAFARR